MPKKLLATLGVLCILAMPVLATDPAIIQLQKSVDLLSAQVKALQDSLDGVKTSGAVVQSLLQQNTDAISNLNKSLSALQQSLNSQASMSSQSQDTSSQHYQALSDSLSQVMTQMGHIQDTLKAIQVAQQNIPAPASQAMAQLQPNTMTPLSAGGANTAAQPAAGSGANGDAVLPAGTLYTLALGDFADNNLKVAKAEFISFLTAYPGDTNAAAAHYYLANIYLQQKNYDLAISSFNDFMDAYPKDAKIPDAELNKASALLGRANASASASAHAADRKAAISELQNVVAKFPDTEQSRLAKEQLSDLGAPTKAAAASGHSPR